MPVATRGAVKGLGPHEIEAAGARILLANLYHLALRPGVEVIEKLGGLHRFCGWEGPMLTDSGGFQVFSLARLRNVDGAGVSFRSHVDGEAIRLTPQSVVEMQDRLGVDIAMMLDECPPWPVAEAAARASLERTLAWARRSRECHERRQRPTAMALFGIVQGSFYPRLRERAVEEMVALDLDGYALGGVSVGESRELSRTTVERFAPVLPEDRPRYLMGVGTPADLLHGVRHGVDLFDCVLPARNGRHGVLFTRDGVLRIKNAVYREDERPPDERCACPTCRRASRALLHHLMRSEEMTGKVLATLHNLRFYLDFVADLRQALASGSFEETAGRIACTYTEGEGEGESPEGGRGQAELPSSASPLECSHAAPRQGR